MAWRAARSLTTLHAQLKRGAPRAAPPHTGADEWGLIGDAVHDPTSDHSPHSFAGWGSQIVTAADFPNRPDLGLDAHKVLDDIRRSRDGRVKYGISNAQMFSSYAVTGYPAWTWRPYTGSSDKHYTHGHLSVVGNARADGEQPWATIGGPAAANTTNATSTEDEDDMGASFGPIDILTSDETSLTIPPVQAGAADPRPVWLNLCNAAGGQAYALRIWISVNDTLQALSGGGLDSNGMRVFLPGVRWSLELPKGTGGVFISHKAVLQSGDGPKAVEPGVPGAAAINPAHLTVAFERGAVIKP